MALRGINPKVLHAYVPKDQRKEKDPATFYIRALPATEAGKLEDVEMRGIARDESGGLSMSTSAELGTNKIVTIKKALRKWKNITIKVPDGEWIEAELKLDANGEPLDECITIIPPEYRTELAEAILDLNDLDENDIKN